jgi:hypothetical protein
MGKLDNQVHAVIQTLFPKNDAVFQGDSAPELFIHVQSEAFTAVKTAFFVIHDLKSIKINFSIFRGQLYHHTSTSLNHSGDNEEQILAAIISKAT